MDSTIAAALVGGVTGVLTGGLSSLAAPWAQWGIEKRRVRMQERRDLAKSWRNLMTRVDGTVLGEPLSRYLAREEAYSALRRRCSATELRLLEGVATHAELVAYLREQQVEYHGVDLRVEVLRFLINRTLRGWRLD